MVLFLSLALLAGMAMAEKTAARRLLIGVMSTLQDEGRRNAMRDTWVLEARSVAPSLTVRFVLGWGRSDLESLAILRENATYGDLIVLPCQENQHRGKTLHWFAFAHAARAQLPHDYVAKMDQDVLVWPSELQEQLQGLVRENFYGGVPVEAYRRNSLPDRFLFTNGGFVLLSADLVAEIAIVVQEARQKADPKTGFLDDVDPDNLKGNEDLILGRLLKSHWSSGRLNVNVGAVSWSAKSGESTSGFCPWRHAKSLKTPEGYREQWASRHERGCRCNCPDTQMELELDEEQKLSGQSSSATKVAEKTEWNLRPAIWMETRHMTDGVGGHAMRAAFLLGTAELLGLRVVCNPETMFNGHSAVTDPHIASALLLHCGGDGKLLGDIDPERHMAPASMLQQPPVINTSLSALPSLLAELERKAGAEDGRDVSHAPALAISEVLCHELIEGVSARSHFMNPALTFLRREYHRGADPERLAAPLWGDATYRIAVHWRTGMWSLKSRRMQMPLQEIVRRILKRFSTVSGPNVHGSQARPLSIALVVAMKEDPRSQATVQEHIDAILAEYGSAAKAYISISGEIGHDDPSALERDLALLTTAHLLLLGRSQFATLAAGLQREDGAHVVADESEFTSESGCQLLSNTVFAAELPTRLLGAGDIKAFVEAGPTRLVCRPPLANASQLVEWLGHCSERTALIVAEAVARRRDRQFTDTAEL
mmetsp:Transcript_9184/g.20319  ORF Transcript_9184/g.20319 Transcript_9184/m.20319 type:complete len:711 (-) Transcript_9184:63-2195(-)